MDRSVCACRSLRFETWMRPALVDPDFIEYERTVETIEFCTTLETVDSPSPRDPQRVLLALVHPGEGIIHARSKAC